MPQGEHDRSAASIIEFCRFARQNGLSAGVLQTLAAIEAAKMIGTIDREDFAFALRSVLSSSKEEWDLFDELFHAFWNFRPRASAAESKEEKEAKFTAYRPRASSRALTTLLAGDTSTPDDDGKDVSGASAERRLQRVDLSEVPQDDLAALEEISLRLFRKMSLRLSRRLKITSLADRVDIRRTIRKSVPCGGDPIDLALKGRKLQKCRLVIFVDISGSMNSYSLFLVRFAYALQKHFKRVSTFLFSTNIVEITDLLRTRHLPDA